VKPSSVTFTCEHCLSELTITSTNTNLSLRLACPVCWERPRVKVVTYTHHAVEVFLKENGFRVREDGA
jgi:hypothetical protein